MSDQKIQTRVENIVFYKSAQSMIEVPDSSIQLIVTSPPYYNVKDYSKDGYQESIHSIHNDEDVGYVKSIEEYIEKLLPIWKECERILKPNGKLCINVPLMPLLKKDSQTHYNRDIIDLQSTIQQSILKRTGLHLLDLYIWNRTNWSKHLMFGSYPYPRNFYAQNSCEFITIYVKDGKPDNQVDERIKNESILSKDEWIEFTKQIWNIPIPGKNDKAFGIHPAIMPEEIPRRLIKMFTFKNDIVLDPFAGSGTTLKVAKELERKYIGYELYEHYRQVIMNKLGETH